MIKTLATITIIIRRLLCDNLRHDEATQNRLDQVCFERWGETTIGSSALYRYLLIRVWPNTQIPQRIKLK